MTRINKDIYASVFFIVFSIVMFIASNSIIKLTVSRLGADFAPKLVAVGIFILSIFYLITSLKKQKQDNNQAVSKKTEEEKGSTNEKKKISPLSVLLTVGLLVLYVVLMPTIGFLITTVVYLFFQMYFLAAKSERRIPLFVGISIVTSVSVYYLFKSVFYLMLPAGILG
ncbi:tripartite tricarboxylate transporter TctB family protein [Metabacillus endolithicus]|uniref:Tripartite tricarboxylate transporter TctB family protein n=1 Tax=Metabacillus endolithicus TaxID=1535204 RepID=A0ABW5BSV9_9BACI|nr:tripartite tricarboxylate transporter TctB family protein [Metabacillus endolithicus]UPG63419.1 tripartite tricarboxylate transporter TctB family protein [Metabacillus endolithicus]